jgi:eukaryotic-like serine/threonine-protein kinase
VTDDPKKNGNHTFDVTPLSRREGPTRHSRSSEDGGRTGSASRPTEISRPADPNMLPIPRTVGGGRYAIKKILGRGGVAQVYRAFDHTLRVDRAIKLIATSDQEMRSSLKRRLEAEARAMVQLNHPNLLAVHDSGEEDGVYYFVTDVAEGGTVMERIDQAGPIPLQTACTWIIETLAALSAAHDAKIIHRDVKPQNLLIDAYGRILLSDFGIALVDSAERRTRAGVAMGSFAYMPPEQRLDASKVNETADIYAVGATLYHMVTGENPVDLFLVDPGSARWRKVPSVLRPILQRATAQHPADRYATVGDMAHDLQRVLGLTEDRSAVGRIAPFVGPTPLTVKLPATPLVPEASTWPYFLLGVAIAALASFVAAYALQDAIPVFALGATGG